jgi:hypothetical protein
VSSVCDFASFSEASPQTDESYDPSPGSLTYPEPLGGAQGRSQRKGATLSPRAPRERAKQLETSALSRRADLHPYLRLDTGGEKVQGRVLNPEGV